MAMKKTKIFGIVFLIALIAAGSFSYGVIWYRNKLPPYQFLEKIFGSPSSDYVDISDAIRLHSKEDVFNKRKQLIRFIWGNSGFPTAKTPDDIAYDHKDARYSDFRNLKKIDRFTINMEKNFRSVAYHFHPISGARKLVIYHQGHDGDFWHGRNTIRFFLENGYDVAAFAMPSAELDSKRVDLVEQHNHLRFLKLRTGSPIKFFAEPVAVVLNFLEKENYDAIYMVGISGGGWTTTLYSAIDTRISKSYPVAGSLPLDIRTPREYKDYEQILPELYEIANYPEMYLMGAYGEERGQLQVINLYDPICFGGIRYKFYENVVRKAVSELGKGSFGVFLDTTHKEHKISEEALWVILKDMEEN